MLTFWTAATARLVVLSMLAGGARASGDLASRPAGGGGESGGLTRAFDSLDRLSLRGNVTPEEVNAVVEEGIERGEALKKRLTTGGDAPGADRSRLREQLCSVELLIGDLHCRGAELLEGEAAALRFNQALQVYRRARVEFRDAAVSLLGYIGESKVMRLQERPAEAAAALEPVREMTRRPTTAVQVELGRIVAMEQLEILRISDPAGAVRAIAKWRSSRGVAEDPTWSARAEWLGVQAAVEVLLRWPATRPDGPAAEKRIADVVADLRSGSVARAVSARERLGLLVKLESRLQASLMTAGEAAEWADLLAAAEAPNALVFYRRAAAQDGKAVPVDSGLRFAALLIQGRSYQEAADWCRELAKRVEASEGQRTTSVRLASACLVQLFRAAEGPADRKRFGREAAALLSLSIRDQADPAVRRECLREWTEVVGGLEGAGACVSTLEANMELVQEDAWLLYALAAGRRDGLLRQQGSRADANTKSASTQPAGALASEIASLLEKAREQARHAGASDLQGRIVLLLAAVRAEPPLLDKRAAMKALLEDWGALEAQPALVPRAVQARLGLLVDLGLTDDALKFVEQLPADGVNAAGDGLLSLAALLAERLASASTSARDGERERIRGLCQRAVSGNLSEGDDHAAKCMAAARVLLQIGAGRDARALLEGLGAGTPSASGEPTRLAVRLLIAEAYGQEGNLNQAIGLCDELLGEFPRSGQVLMTRARLGLAANHPADAASWFRKARESARAGSEEWCSATLGLVDALLQEGRRADAAGLLRVCLALYPDFGNPELLSWARKLQVRAADSHAADLPPLSSQ